MTIAVRAFLWSMLAVISAAALAANVAYIRSLGTDEYTAAIYTAFAVFSSGAKIGLPLVGWLPSRVFNVAAVVLFGVCIAFDVLCGFGYAGLTRGAKVETAEQAATARVELAKEVERLKARYQEVEALRPTAVVTEERDAQAARAGNCTSRGDPNSPGCKKLSALNAELAGAEDRDKREREWRDTRSKLEALPPAGTADAQALAAKSFMGWDIRRAFSVAFSVLVILLTELGPPVFSYAAVNFGRAPAKPRAPAQPSAPTPPAKRTRANGVTGDDVLSTLTAIVDGRAPGDGVKVSGRQIVGNQRSLGALCGMSGAALNGHLATLAASKRIGLATGPGGTVVTVL